MTENSTTFEISLLVPGLIAPVGRLGHIDETGIPRQEEIELNGHALQCRITTENPDNNFIPDYGRITAYRGAFGFGIRVNGGTAYSGAVVTRYYDPLLEKVTAWAPSPGGPSPVRLSSSPGDRTISHQTCALIKG